MNGDFAAKFIWACAFLFVYSLAGEIFLFKIVKMNLTNSRRKKSPQLFDQSEHKLSTMSSNKFPSNQMEDIPNVLSTLMPLQQENVRKSGNLLKRDSNTDTFL